MVFLGEEVQGSDILLVLLCLWLKVCRLIARRSKDLMGVGELIVRGLLSLTASLLQVGGILIVRHDDPCVAALAVRLPSEVSIDVEVVKLEILDVLIISVESLEALIKRNP